MNRNDIEKCFEDGDVYFLDFKTQISDLEWKDHPKFLGVSLKELIGGTATNGQMSCHLVRIQPGCEIGSHIHEGRMELHEVISGEGICYLKDKIIPYEAGKIAVIPSDIIHRVTAGENGLFIMAKFLPALS